MEHAVTRSLRCAVLLLPLAALLAAGCAGRDPAREEKALLARSQALIEAGNVAYRARDYDDAAKRYAAAAVVKKDDAAAYFGLGMALAKLGRDEEARASYAQARLLAQRARDSAAAGR
jgi:Flp pilus assembly protein TadD